MPSLDNVEDYLASVEEYFHTSLSAVTHSLPDVHEVVNQLWIDISRYGPGMPAFPEVHIPTLQDFQVPPPPPPPPPPTTWVDRSTGWVERHPWKAGGLVVGLVGVGLLVTYRDVFARRNQRHLHVTKKSSSPDRRQIVGEDSGSMFLIALYSWKSSCAWRRYAICFAINPRLGEEGLYRYCQCFNS